MYYIKGRYASNPKNTTATTSTSADFPTATEGCVKQGECTLPYLQLSKEFNSPPGVTGTGAGGVVAMPSDATLDRLLAGAIENPPGACRDIYPRRMVTATHYVMASITVAVPPPPARPSLPALLHLPFDSHLPAALLSQGELASFSTSVLTAMEAKVAHEMGVAPGNVDIKAEAGSVVLTINIGYDSAATAATAKTTMTTAMSSNSAAAAMLSTPTMAMTDAMVTAVGAPTSGSGAMAASPSPPPAPALPPPKTDSDDGLSVGAIAGIAIGASVAVILVAGVAIFVMSKKKKAIAATKGNP